MDKIYFAHPTSMYSTPIESVLIRLIARELADGDLNLIENPNQPYHQVGYNQYAKRVRESGTNHKGMSYFYAEVLPGCTGGCVGAPFLDGRLGLGVAGEMKWSLERGRPVWTVVPSNKLLHNGTQVFVRDIPGVFFSVRPITDEEAKLVLSEDPKLVVPHQETRLRSWMVYDRIIRPYELAHLVTMPIPDGFYLEG